MSIHGTVLAELSPAKADVVIVVCDVCASVKTSFGLKIEKMFLKEGLGVVEVTSRW